MQIIDTRNKFYLHSYKIVFVLLSIGFSVSAQTSRKYSEINLPNSETRLLSYGYFVGVGSSYYRLEYDDMFQGPDFSNTVAINPLSSRVFSIGPIVSVKLFQFLKLQSKMKPTFYDNKIEFVNTDGSIETSELNSVRAEFPLLLKYMSKRRKNSRMFMIGGINPSWRFTTRNNEEALDNIILEKAFNFSVEIGFGFDIYFPLFKLSPEFRYSYGFTNLLSDINPDNPVTKALKGLYLNSISFYIQVGD